jgi:hypothetical protein
MRKVCVVLLVCVALCSQSVAQKVPPGDIPKKIKPVKPGTPAAPSPKVQLLSVTAHVPLDAFAKSHIAGLGISYTWGQYSYNSYYKKNKIAFTANGGVDYYIGKKKEIAAHNFNYGSYTYLYAQAGALYGIYRKVVISLTAGPGMGLYKGNFDFGLSSSLFGALYIEHSRFLLGPGITFKKHSNTNALWTAAIRASCFF